MSNSWIGSLKAEAGNTIRGFCMGAADVVPGVSGGTVALILGIYGRLVTAISHVDMELLQLLRQRRWKAAASHLDLAFLVMLGAGIVVGFGVMTTAMHRLLTDPDTRALTLAAFFGMILASAFIVGSLIRARNLAEGILLLLLGAAGAALAYGVTLLQVGQAEISYGYLFLCGAIAICAMILPGISGAMVLLIMGVYVHLTEIPHHLAHGEHVAESLLMLVCFGAGCAIGIVSFSKLLKFLLHRFHNATMAVLCGFMFGALIKIWPFQKDLSPDVEEFKLKQFEPQLPTEWGTQTWSVFAVMLIATIFVIVVDRFTRGRSEAESHRA